MATVDRRDAWREHFSVNAGDLVQLHRWICGDSIAQQIMLECFRRSPRSGKINESTVLNVLHDMELIVDEAGNVTIAGVLGQERKRLANRVRRGRK
jgi:hypothetical protein